MDLADVLHKVVQIEAEKDSQTPGKGGSVKVVEFVQGELLVLEIDSKSRPGCVTHFLSVVVDEQGLTDMTCSCESFEFRQTCRHVSDTLNRLHEALDWLDETLSAWKDALSAKEDGGR